jgi:2-methylcitrate dehydratase PrpD
MEITRTLAEYVVNTGPADLPAEAVTQAKRAMLDTLGVMLAGSAEPCARIAAGVVAREEGKPVAAVIGQGFAAPARGAALVNGTAAHALDYDDVTTSMRGHPSPPLVPAVLAVGEETNAAGIDLITAYLLGFEVQCKVGRGLGDSHYPHGWHATATLGTLGAAVAAAKLYGLDVERTRMALGIAASLAAGSRQNFGTMTKPLHPGNAAQSGILAAQLAAGGYTADESIIETPLGFLNLFSPAKDARPERVLPELGNPLDILAVGIGVKKYPCCYGTHNALDAILALRDREGFSAEQVDWITVTVPQGAEPPLLKPRPSNGYVAADGREAPPVAHGPLIHPRPTTGLEGKFSMQYCMAAAVLDGNPVLDTFIDTAVQRPAAQTLLRRVEFVQTGELVTSGRGYAEVAVALRDGRTLRARSDQPRGGPDTPLTWDELAAKYRDCAARVIGTEATERSLALIGDLERLATTTDLTRVVAGRQTAVGV